MKSLQLTKCNMCIILDPAHKKIDDVSAEDFRSLLDLNLISYFLTSKVARQINHLFRCIPSSFLILTV